MTAASLPGGSAVVASRVADPGGGGPDPPHPDLILERRPYADSTLEKKHPDPASLNVSLTLFRHKSLFNTFLLTLINELLN